MEFKFLVTQILFILGLPEEFKGKRKRKDGLPYEEKEKVVLDGTQI